MWSNCQIFLNETKYFRLNVAEIGPLRIGVTTPSSLFVHSIKGHSDHEEAKLGFVVFYRVYKKRSCHQIDEVRIFFYISQHLIIKCFFVGRIISQDYILNVGELYPFSPYNLNSSLDQLKNFP